MEKQIVDKIAKLRTMNVDPYEIEKLIRVLAVMRIDGITSTESAHKLSGKMKQSARAAQKECNNLRQQANGLSRKSYYYQKRAEDYDEIISAIEYIHIYPQERKSAEQKKNPPKKKHRR